MVKVSKQWGIGGRIRSNLEGFGVEYHHIRKGQGGIRRGFEQFREGLERRIREWGCIIDWRRINLGEVRY